MKRMGTVPPIGCDKESQKNWVKKAAGIEQGKKSPAKKACAVSNRRVKRPTASPGAMCSSPPKKAAIRDGFVPPVGVAISPLKDDPRYQEGDEALAGSVKCRRSRA